MPGVPMGAIASKRAVRWLAGPMTLATLCLLMETASPVRVAWAEPPDPTPEFNAERDTLLEKIARGQDFEASVRRFAMLLKQRDTLIATSRAAQEQKRREIDTRAAWQEAYRKTVDHDASWRCVLSVDPRRPVQVAGVHGNFPADWGRVVRKETIRLPPKNDLDEGERVTMYEVAGLARRYLIRGEHYGHPYGGPLVADKGDLLLVCDGGTDHDERLPPSWSGDIQRAGYAAPLTAPPRIADKGRWNPIHITNNFFFWAIHDVRWRIPPNIYVLSNIEIVRELGGGRYEIAALQDKTWVLEVPPTVKRREILVPGHMVWAIMGGAHFDRELKKLVLVAEDLEERYIPER
jgi:hypothetical protein